MYYLNGGVGALEALRKPLVVNRATFERARENLKFQPMADRIDPAKRLCWFRTKTGLDVPYWTMPEYREREQDPSTLVKSGLLYQPFWMTNKSRTRLIQRPSLQIKPRSEVLTHLGTDEESGLGKGGIIGKITKPIKKVAKIVTKALPDIATGGLYSVAKAGINVVRGKQSILGGLKSAIVRQGPAGALLTAAVGENKSLAIQAAVAGGALTAAGAAAGGTGGLLMKAGGKMLPGAVGTLTQAPQGPMPAPADYPPMPAGTYAYPPGFMPDYTPGAAPGAVPGADPFGGPVQAGMFGNMSPMMIGLLIGVPLLFSLMTSRRERR